jgi:hypothetical protein
MPMKSATPPFGPASILDTETTGQRRSLEPEKATHQKNSGTRAKSGGEGAARGNSRNFINK